MCYFSDMNKKSEKDREIDFIYQRARDGVSDLSNKQREIALSYIKKVEQINIKNLRDMISKS